MSNWTLTGPFSGWKLRKKIYICCVSITDGSKNNVTLHFAKPLKYGPKGFDAPMRWFSDTPVKRCMARKQNKLHYVRMEEETDYLLDLIKEKTTTCILHCSQIPARLHKSCGFSMERPKKLTIAIFTEVQHDVLHSQ